MVGPIRPEPLELVAQLSIAHLTQPAVRDGRSRQIAAQPLQVPEFSLRYTPWVCKTLLPLRSERHGDPNMMFGYAPVSIYEADHPLTVISGQSRATLDATSASSTVCTTGVIGL